MKRLIVLMAMVILLPGCVITMQVKGDDEVTGITEIIARRIGHKVARNESIEKIQYLKEKCDEILEADIEDSYPLIENALRYATTQYTGDPLLYDDVMSLCKLFGVDMQAPDIDLDMGELRTFRAGVKAFRKMLGVVT